MIDSGSAALDGPCKQRDSEGNPTMKPHWESLSKRLTLASPLPNGAQGIHRILPWRQVLSPLPYRRRRPVHHDPCQHHRRPRTGMQIAEGWSVELPKDVHDILNKHTTQPGKPPRCTAPHR
ncbi:hypothetical protein ACLK19_18740 [Escherichia coli]